MQHVARLLFAATLLAHVCLDEGGTSVAEEGNAAWEGGHMSSSACGKLQDATRDKLRESLESIDHDELVQLLHRAAATPRTVLQVRAKSLSGADLAGLSTDRVRELLNCSAGQRCFLPAWCPASPAGVSTEEDDPLESIGQVAVARYTGMHPNLLEYARRHAESRWQPPSARNRFVVWTCGCCGEPCSGWGNRMLGMVSALMLAVLTERTFLIHWPHDACADVAEYLGSEWIDWRMPRNFRDLMSPSDQEYLVNFEPTTGFEMSEKMRRFNPRLELDDKAIIWMRASHGLFIDLWRNPHLSVCLRLCVCV